MYGSGGEVLTALGISPVVGDVHTLLTDIRRRADQAETLNMTK